MLYFVLINLLIYDLTNIDIIKYLLKTIMR